MAKSKRKKKKSLERKRARRNRKNSIRKSSSSYLRAKKKFGVSARAGNVWGGVMGGGGEGNMPLAPSTRGFGQYVMGKLTLPAADFEEDIYFPPATLTVNIMSAGVRHFFGNSFSVSGAIGYRTFAGSFEMISRGEDLSAKVSLEGSSVIILPAIGNHWILDSGIVLGCDWIGASIPISSSSQTTVTTTGPWPQEIQEELQVSMTEITAGLASSTGGQVLMLNIGYMF